MNTLSSNDAAVCPVRLKQGYIGKEATEEALEDDVEIRAAGSGGRDAEASAELNQLLLDVLVNVGVFSSVYVSADRERCYENKPVLSVYHQT